jgi:hypothetical protein
MSSHRIWVDFMKTDDLRRLVLTTLGTLADLRKHQIELREGLRLGVFGDDADDEGRPDNLLVDGTVRFDEGAGRWVLEIDWSAIRHESDVQPPGQAISSE